MVNLSYKSSAIRPCFTIFLPEIGWEFNSAASIFMLSVQKCASNLSKSIKKSLLYCDDKAKKGEIRQWKCIKVTTGSGGASMAQNGPGGRNPYETKVAGCGGSGGC